MVTTYWIATRGEGNVGHVVTGDRVVAFERVDLQTARIDDQRHVAAGVLHVRGVAQNALDAPIHLTTTTREMNNMEKKKKKKSLLRQRQ